LGRTSDPFVTDKKRKDFLKLLFLFAGKAVASDFFALWPGKNESV